MIKFSMGSNFTEFFAFYLKLLKFKYYLNDFYFIKLKKIVQVRYEPMRINTPWDQNDLIRRLRNVHCTCGGKEQAEFFRMPAYWDARL